MDTFARLAGLSILAVMVSLALAACSGGDDNATPPTSGGSAIETFASRTQAEFNQRAQGTFFDTGVLSYCRQNTGFDSSVFKALGYTNENAPKDVELCYNVNIDRKKVALGATSSKGDRECVVLDASGGTIVRTTKPSGSCAP